jgi:hypothetical protein
MIARTIALLLLIGLFVGLVRSALADPAPSGLYNKTVVLTWTEIRVQLSEEGEIRKTTTHSEFTIYVSTAGRLFSQFTRKNNIGLSNSSAMSPNGETTFSGVGQGPRTTRFEDRQLISENQMKSGARRIQADFDSNYRSCTLRVIYGKEGASLNTIKP